MSDKTYILYHAGCMDGTLAAAVVGDALYALRQDRLFQEGALGSVPPIPELDIEFIAMNYNEPAPEMEDGSMVYIVDFSFSRDVLEEMVKTKQVQVLDHHAQAEEDLKGLDFATFSKEECGAVMAWKHFNGKNKVPEILLYVQDRDLWNWELSDSREINLALRIHGMGLDTWQSLIEAHELLLPQSYEDPNNGIAKLFMKNLKEQGHALMSYQNGLIDSTCMKASREDWGEFGSPIVVNASIMQSEMAEALLEKFPEVPFAVVWCHNNDQQLVLYSLRSRQSEDVDVAEICKELGGGGHKHAAGFTDRVFPSDRYISNSVKTCMLSRA